MGEREIKLEQLVVKIRQTGPGGLVRIPKGLTMEDVQSIMWAPIRQAVVPAEQEVNEHGNLLRRSLEMLETLKRVKRSSTERCPSCREEKSHWTGCQLMKLIRDIEAAFQNKPTAPDSTSSSS